MQHPPTTFSGIAPTPKKAANACLFCFRGTGGAFQIAVRLKNLVAVGYRIVLGGTGTGLL
jgi:hypothetical protein